MNEMIQEGEFSPLLSRICRTCGVPQAEQWFRTVAACIAEQRGSFTLGNDKLSWLMYDLQYMLYTFAKPRASVKEFLAECPQILFGDAEFHAEGYSADAIADWMEQRAREGSLVQAGIMIGQKNCMVFTAETMEQIVLRCKSLAETTA